MLSPPDPDSTDVTRSPSCSRRGELRRLNGYRRVLALCMQSQHNSCMATSITIRDVPDKARDELAARAALSGRSLQEYLRAQLIELASRPDMGTVLARIRERKQQTGTRLSREKILAHHREDHR